MREHSDVVEAVMSYYEAFADKYKDCIVGNYTDKSNLDKCKCCGHMTIKASDAICPWCGYDPSNYDSKRYLKSCKKIYKKSIKEDKNYAWILDKHY